VPTELPADLRRSRDFSVEMDAMPGGYVCSASLKGKVRDDVVLGSVSGKRPLSKLFTKNQRAFFAANAADMLSIDDLSVLGPIFVLKLRLEKVFSRRLVVEMWLYPDGSRILELSTKCLPDEGLSVALELRRFFEERGIEISDQQQTKTKTALQFYASELERPRTPTEPPTMDAGRNAWSSSNGSP
jgi:hypothetical protein